MANHGHSRGMFLRLFYQDQGLTFFFLKKTLNFVGMVIVAVGPSYGVTFFGYLLNAASWGFWPVLYVNISLSQVFTFHD